MTDEALTTRDKTNQWDEAPWARDSSTVMSSLVCTMFQVQNIYPYLSLGEQDRFISFLPKQHIKKIMRPKVNQATTESKWIKVGLRDYHGPPPWALFILDIRTLSHSDLALYIIILHYTIIPIKTLKACRKLFIRLVSGDLPSSMTVAIAGHQSTSAGNLPGWSNPGCLVPTSHP